jgi:hypothetical protein
LILSESVRMRAYSEDLRLKVLDAVDRGMPREEVARVFGISLPSIKRRSYSQASVHVRTHYAAHGAVELGDAIVVGGTNRR